MEEPANRAGGEGERIQKDRYPLVYGRTKGEGLLEEWHIRFGHEENDSE